MTKVRALGPQWAEAQEGLVKWTVAAKCTVGHREEWAAFPLFELPALTKWVKKYDEDA
jgi:hypothetical protein